MEAEPLSATFAALSDPTRRAILARLVKGEALVGELADPFTICLPAISRHLKVLQQAGPIERKAEAQWRRCALNPESLIEAASWIDRYSDFWESRFDALEGFLKFELNSKSPRIRGQQRKPKNDN
jgi:DNA-binding transcriptional ArsR family regulator